MSKFFFHRSAVFVSADEENYQGDLDEGSELPYKIVFKISKDIIFVLRDILL